MLSHINIHIWRPACVVLAYAFALPVSAADIDLTYVIGAVGATKAIVDELIPLTIALGMLFFIWGLVLFILSSGNEDAKEVGVRRMVWGILALFVIVSVWGLVGLLSQLTGVEQGAALVLPDVPTL